MFPNNKIFISNNEATFPQAQRHPNIQLHPDFGLTINATPDPDSDSTTTKTATLNDTKFGFENGHVSPNNAVHWWLPYFHVGYFVGFISFRICQSTKNGKDTFELQRTTLHTVIYFLLQSMGLFTGVKYVRQINKKVAKVDATMYFVYAAMIGEIVNRIVFPYLLWTNAQIFLEIVNEISNSRKIIRQNEPDEGEREEKVVGWTWTRKWISMMKNKIRFTSTCTKSWIFVTLSYLSVGSILFEKLSDVDWNGRAFMSVLRNQSQDYLGFALSFNPNQTDDVAVSECIVHGFTTFWFYFHEILYSGWESFTVLTILLYCQLVDEFCFKIRIKNVDDITTNDKNEPQPPSPTPNSQEVIAEFKWLQNVIRLLNLAFGTGLFTVIIGALPYYIGKIPEIMEKETFGNRQIRQIFYFTYYIGQLFYAALKCQKLDKTMRTWMSKHANVVNLPEKQRAVISFEVNARRHMALTMNDMYALNPSLFTSIMSALITYSIISVQLQRDENVN